MVKNSKKLKNNIQPPAAPPQAQPNKCTSAKSSKKSEKPKAAPSVTTNITKAPQKYKGQDQPQEQTETPCTSKKAVANAQGNGFRQKNQSKSPCGIWKRVDKKKEVITSNSRKHFQTPRKLSPIPERQTNQPQQPGSGTSPPEDATNYEENEITTLLQSGVIRYSDVVRSKNVSSSASLKPPNIIKLPPPSSTSNGKSTNEATTINLEYFPELGQHKSWQSPNAGSSSRFSRKPTSIGSDEKSTLLCVPESPNIKSESSDNNNRKETTPTEDVTATDNNESTPLCQQCQLDSDWLERVIQNSAKPFHINIAEFNFLQPDIAYPRFLMQFEDENYLKAENMALLGLKLALGGNFHRHHANCK